jgi:hypothetical protein
VLKILSKKSGEKEMYFSNILDIASQDLIKKYPKIKLMRHQFQDDKRILKENDTHIFSENMIGSDSEALLKSNLTTEDKLAAIRTNSILAEISCAEQGKDQLVNTEIVFAFAASIGSSAEFIGAFKILGVSSQELFLDKYKAHLSILPEKLSSLWKFDRFVTKLGYSKWPRKTSFYYDLELLNDPINEYKNRVIIDWPSPRVWVQKNLEKEVIAIRAKGFVRDFTDFYDFILPFDELKMILKHRDGNPAWISKLSAVSGVYLITDNKTGHQYIGSAYGSEGFLGRWENYANNNHGDNKSLKSLIVEHGEDYAVNFQISILRVMDKSSSKADVIAAESFLKNKMGTRVHGLNNN